MPRIKSTLRPTAFTAKQIEASALRENNDCSVKAISIACGVPYAEVHALMKSLGRKDRRATPRIISRRTVEALGYRIREWSIAERINMIRSYPRPHCGLSSITTHHPRRFPAAWVGCHSNMIWTTARHMLAVKDGAVQDWSINNALRVDTIWEVEKV